MGEEPNVSGIRYVRLDIHKQYSVIGGVNREEEIYERLTEAEGIKTKKKSLKERKYEALSETEAHFESVFTSGLDTVVDW